MFVETKVMVNYVPIERRSGNTLIFFRFLHPAEGIWKLETSGRLNSSARLCMASCTGDDLRGDVFSGVISGVYGYCAGRRGKWNDCDSYQYRDDSFTAKPAGGYNTDNVVKPDFAAPGWI